MGILDTGSSHCTSDLWEKENTVKITKLTPPEYLTFITFDNITTGNAYDAIKSD
jgi:hypothetical protein